MHISLWGNKVFTSYTKIAIDESSESAGTSVKAFNINQFFLSSPKLAHTNCWPNSRIRKFSDTLNWCGLKINYWKCTFYLYFFTNQYKSFIINVKKLFDNVNRIKKIAKIFIIFIINCMNNQCSMFWYNHRSIFKKQSFIVIMLKRNCGYSFNCCLLKTCHIMYKHSV